MASRSRLRKDVNATLTRQFQEWGLPLDIDYKSYCGIVDFPVTPRAIQKSFYNWKTCLRSLRIETPKAAPAPAAPKKEAPKKEPAKKKVETKDE